jgi:hypothetical protein
MVHLVFIACTATLPGGATVAISRAFAVAVCRAAAVVVSCLRCCRLLVLAGQCVWRHEGRRPQERHRQSAAALLQRILQVELPVVREYLQGAAPGLSVTLVCVMATPAVGGKKWSSATQLNRACHSISCRETM